MLSPSRERVVCFEGEVAYAARFERVCSYPEARRLFSGSWSGMGQTAIRMCTTEAISCLPLDCEGPHAVGLPADANGRG